MDKAIKYNDALKRVMKLCSERELCRQDIYEKLSKWEVEAGDKEKIISLLSEEKFIDETRYASAFAKDKFRYNKWGRVKIAMMLRSKGIDEKTITTALDSLDEDSYTKTLRKIITAHKKSVKAGSLYELKGKLARYAISKGFESGLVYDILENEI